MTSRYGDSQGKAFHPYIPASPKEAKLLSAREDDLCDQEDRLVTKDKKNLLSSPFSHGHNVFMIWWVGGGLYGDVVIVGTDRGIWISVVMPQTGKQPVQEY